MFQDQPACEPLPVPLYVPSVNVILSRVVASSLQATIVNPKAKIADSPIIFFHCFLFHYFIDYKNCKFIY